MTEESAQGMLELTTLIEKAMDEWENDREAEDTVSCAQHIAITISSIRAVASPVQGAGEPLAWRDVQMVALINLLRSQEGDSVEILCDNPDFNGQPNCAVVCSGGWTDWQDRRFAADTVLDALSSAATEYRMPAPRVIVAESNGHHWVQRFHLTCCRDCGIVRRADDKNNPCKGVVRVGPRAPSSDRPASAPDVDFTVENAWSELVEKDDRTSPEEYPDMALITSDELANFMRRYALHRNSAHQPQGGDAREDLEDRCSEFLLRDNKKARTTVIAVKDFANFVMQEIALATPPAPVRAAAEPGEILTKEEKFILEWLNKAEGQYGECHGKTLDRLIDRGFAVVQGGHPDIMFRTVYITDAGRAALSPASANEGKDSK